MGEKKKVTKVVLDTNILVSALLFKGELSGIVDLWKAGDITPIISRETFEELKEVLHYPKFKLTKDEIKNIIEDDILPFFEVTIVTENVNGACRDADDDKFIACALSAEADILVSGDKDLCDMETYKSIRIMKGREIVNMFSVKGKETK